MRLFRLALLIAGLIGTLTACKKEFDSSDCDKLKDGLLTNNTKLVTESIGSLLTSYSEANLDELANKITDKCNIPATADCFNCIKTNPPQTEMIFLLVEPGTTIQKKLDISYNSDNKMQLRNVHD
jgi:hypothetical protein